MPRPVPVRVPTAAVLVAVGLLVGGCGRNESARPTRNLPAVSRNPALTALLPAGIRRTGVLQVATNAPYAPMEFFDTATSSVNTTLVGADIDLASAVGTVLGVRVRFRTTPFRDVLPGVTRGTYDLGMSAITVTSERARTADFVTYLSTGSAVMVKAGNPGGIPGPGGLCGRVVAVERDTVQDADAGARSAACTAAGNKALRILRYDAQPQANDALRSGRAAAVLADAPVVGYAIKQNSRTFARAGATYHVRPYGIAVRRGNGQLGEAVRRAVQAVMDSATYRAILDRWGITDTALGTASLVTSRK